MTLPSAILFGPQTKLPTLHHLQRQRDILRSDPQLKVLLETIQSLPSLWSLLLSHEPRFSRIPGHDLVSHLTGWLGEEPAPSVTPSHNIICTPLTVITQVLDYVQYLRDNESNFNHSQLLAGLSLAGIQGFCTGFLSAAAIACSENVQDIAKYASVVVKLALVIGAYVDLDAELNNLETVCVVVKGKTKQSDETKLSRHLETFSGAYVSVVFDEDNFTITVPKSHAESLTEALSTDGFIVRDVPIQGRFHSSVNKTASESISDFIRQNEFLRLPEATSLFAHMRTNVDGAPVQEKDSLSSIAVSVLLTDVSNWHVTMSETFRHVLPGSDVVTFSVSDIVPPSIQRASPAKIHKMPSVATELSMGGQLADKASEYNYPPHAVAIVGMACKYAGVDSLDEFWEVISKGASMHGEVPEERWARTGLRRTKEGSKYFGNFVRDADAFDHRFFKKSAREAAAMDPQQRILLQAAYQAVESSGYLTERDAPEDVGCYIGVATTDYHDNIASQAPTAFSAIGELRAFLCGRISHHFGWTGPSMTYDTACSASMVAIDAACRSIQTGQCSRALAGGVSLNSSPNLWENLRAANFLSPTGPTKPFDAAGDGYCRGEGVGLIFLKKLSEAVKDGDYVYGVVTGTGVNQCRNDTYITVPNGSSQVDLYKKVLREAGVNPYDVSYIESHGTGTAKGDPTEMASLRSVFGGPSRDSIVSIGSVKGNVGHCEASSGVASVIKTVLAMTNSTIPPLANHNSLNPNIQPLAVDKMNIPLSPQPWNMPFKAALVNNYGAAGSNAALVLCQPPRRTSTRRSINDHSSALSVVPVCIYAHTEQSVRSYCQALCDSLPAEVPSDEIGFLQNLAFNLVKKQNRTLAHRFITSVSTVEALKSALKSPDQFIQQHQDKKAETSSVVLSFGGQTNNHVGLSQHLYFESALLRFHLENCNRAIRKAGYKSIFPTIFQTKPVTDVVSLHCLFFAIQYASANAWMDAGVTPAAVIGHSFGQLTAMCISGMISLDDAVKLVAGRASLMQQYWGAESGSMVSVEADTKTTEGVIAAVASEHGLRAEIACYNAPTGHVIVGTSKAMDAVEQICKSSTQPIRHKRLQVTNGFHSEFTEPLIPHLEKLASELQVSQPHIHLEPCSQEPTTWKDMTPAFIANHTRAPVYFRAAVERLEARIGSCVWLEAGSNSSVAAMARRALSGSSVSHTYHGTNLNGKEALNRLAETMVTLWKTMPTIEVGPFYRKKGSAAPYRSIDLPPYQFEKQRHWMTWKDNVDNKKDSAASEAPKTPQESKPEILRQVSADGKAGAHFVIDPRSEEFQHFVKGHAVLDQPLCPADLYVEIAARATRCLQPSQDFIPSVEKLSIVAPLGIDPNKEIYLSMTAAGPTASSWSFTFTSGPRGSTQASDRTKHASGIVKLTAVSDLGFKAEVARYEKLVGSSRATAFLSDHQAEGMKGALVYQVFSKVVAYGDYYQGVKAIASKGDEVGAQIVVPPAGEAADPSMILDPVAVDNFVQVAGIKVNCLNPCPANQVYICGHIERVQATQTFLDLTRPGQKQQTWSVFAQCTPVTEKVYHNDIYVFSEDKKLAMIILGVQFTRVSIMSLASAIAQSNRASAAHKKQPQDQSFYDKAIEKLRGCQEETTAQRFDAAVANKESPTVDVFAKLTDLLHEVAEVPKASVTRSSTFESMGIDSLLTTEVFSAVTDKFGMQIPHQKTAELQDVESLLAFLSVSSRSASPPPGVLSGLSSAGLSSPYSQVSGAATPFTEVSGLTTPAESVTTVSSSSRHMAEKPQPQGSIGGDVEDRLAQVVCQLLEVKPSALSAKGSLEDQGLDSLLTVELTSALEEAFACKIDAGSVHGDMTYEELKGVISSKVCGGMAGSLIRTGVPPTLQDVPNNARRMPGTNMKTLVYKQAGPTSLYADVYLPDVEDGLPRHTALMIHGGGHSMLSRKDVRPKQTALLLANGFLPVSIDYRLCPEVNIIDGAMTDVVDALAWAREKLPQIGSAMGVQVNGEKVAVVGWSTGGTLSLQLGFAARNRGIKAPDATLAFYCPSNYEDEFWKQPNFPENTSTESLAEFDLLEGVRDQPITSYNIDPKSGAVGGWMSPTDPRSRIVLHMNWTGQMLPVILNGLPTRAAADPKVDYKQQPQPSADRIASISPCAQIRAGNYATPTYIVHGTRDDLIPWQQARTTYEALVARGVPAELEIVEGAEHLFDLYRSRGKDWEVVLRGYEFLFKQFR